jgi:hypothetical protein
VPAHFRLTSLRVPPLRPAVAAPPAPSGGRFPTAPLRFIALSGSKARPPQVRVRHLPRTIAGSVPPPLVVARALRSLARSPWPARLLSGFCSSTRGFAPRFFQRQPHDWKHFGSPPGALLGLAASCSSRGLSPPGHAQCWAHKKKNRHPSADSGQAVAGAMEKSARSNGAELSLSRRTEVFGLS